MNTYDFLMILFLIVVVNYLFHHSSLTETKEKIFPKGRDYFTPKEDIELPEIEFEKEIPKVIYKCHRDKKSFEGYEKVFKETKKLNSNYELVYYTDEDIEKFISQNFSERIYTCYKNINPDYGPAKSDFFRYLLIYLKGGIYLDIKSGPVTNLDPLLKILKGRLALSHWTDIPIGYIPIHHIDELYYSHIFETGYGEYQNWHIISGKGNPVLKRVIKQMITNIEAGMSGKILYDRGKESVIYMTGPIMYTQTIEEYGNEKNALVLGKNCGGYLNYKIVDHKKIEGDNHYLKKKSKNILNIPRETK